MKTGYVLITILLATVLNTGQAQKVKWGPTMKVESKKSVVRIVNSNTARLVVLSAEPNGLYNFDFTNCALESFDRQLLQSASLPIEAVYDGQDLTMEFEFESSEKLYLFASFTSKKLGKKYLVMQTVNSNTLVFEGGWKKIDEIDISKKGRGANFNFIFSTDSSKIALITNADLAEDKYENYNLIVFNSHMEKLWSKSVVLPYEEDRFTGVDCNVDNSGNIFILGLYSDIHVATPDAGHVKGLPPIYKIASYTNQGEEFNEYTVSYGDKFITDMRLGLSLPGEIVCAGFYSNKGTRDVDGTYYLRINRKTKEVIKSSGREFALDFIKAGLNERDERKIESRVNNGVNPEVFACVLRNLLIMDDGRIVLVGEQYFAHTNSYYDMVTKRYSYTNEYWYHDIIVVSINSSGNIEWATKVPKCQNSLNDLGIYSSFALMVTDDRIHFIFNDNAKNYMPKEKGKIHNFGISGLDAVVAIASVDSKGEIEQRTLFSSSGMETITIPKSCKQVSANEMVLISAMGRKSQLGVLTF